MKRQLSTLLSLILVIILFVLFLVYLYLLPLHQLPGIILTIVLSFLFFYFLYYGLTYSNNTSIRLIQKCFVFSFCFYVPILISVIFDLYLFQVIFSDVNINNVKDFIRLWLGDELFTFLESFNNFISHISFEQLWAVCNILSSLFILILLLNIISIIYSDYLLTYFKIEEKYPKIGKWIKYRRVWQHYYLIFNLLLIIFTTIAVIFINYNILIM